MLTTHEYLNVISDSRGFVFEPLTAHALCYQHNAHVVISLPGVIRGNHYHKKGEETIAVIGPALVRFRENEKINDIEIQSGEACRFTFPPGVSHAIKNLGKHHNVLVAFNSLEHDSKNPDTVEEILIDN